MIKAQLSDGTALVTFELPAAVAAASVSVCGDFNAWSPTAHPLTRTDTGSFRASVELPAGTRWRFRYLLDGQRWENDWAADAYIPNEFGGDDSVIDLTDTAALPPSGAAAKRSKTARTRKTAATTEAADGAAAAPALARKRAPVDTGSDTAPAAPTARKKPTTRSQPASA